MRWHTCATWSLLNKKSIKQQIYTVLNQMHASLQTFDWQQAIESSSIFDLLRLAFQPRLQPTNLAIPQNVHPRLVVLILYDGINNRHSNICTRSCWHSQFFLRVCGLKTFPGISFAHLARCNSNTVVRLNPNFLAFYRDLVEAESVAPSYSSPNPTAS